MSTGPLAASPLMKIASWRPAGLEEYFAEFGDPVVNRGAPAPQLSEPQFAERMQKAAALASKYRIEIL